MRKNKNREQVKIALESVREGTRCQSMEDRIWEKKSWDWNERMTGWLMTKVVMVTLMRWDDHGSMASQEEADQDWLTKW